MWQRFTERARRIVMEAQQKAQTTYHDCVGLEHFLWGVVQDRDSAACKILQRMGVSLDQLQHEIDEAFAIASPMTSGQSNGSTKETPEPKLTAKSRRVLELAAEEARNMPLNENYIGSEHVLLALLRMQDDLPFTYWLLRQHKLHLETTREQTIIYLRERGSLRTD